MIRRANVNDLSCLVALSLQVWLNTYTLDGMRREYADFAIGQFTKDYFQDLLLRDEYDIIVCEEERAIIGFAVVNNRSQFEGPENGFELEKLYVHSHFQGKGVGRALLSEVTARFGSDFWLYTWTENISNAFYKRLGFELIGELSFEFAGKRILNNVYMSPR
ncbi:GCN5 family acetyltransferase [Pseudoalteromonas luteoviolacea]|uniref:GCN5 family acetyltransferase n=1 Tax=Pseudoalteromonas luteoviolacea TaxID=43657 RepID=A0A1C0TW93_9GAMM|nr:GNAT family N-acetyltransferase [Pseudoalteromonas luteoviolacea]OCQ23580.1 GCN5 family acetyltransferase [Pseudoalteromonas luteoviolacea]